MSRSLGSATYSFPDCYDKVLPAFLFYGVRRNAKRGKSHKKGSSGGTPWRIAPRGNFMIDALNKESPWSKYTLAKELVNSMKQVKQ